jgi:hypothetical protein
MIGRDILDRFTFRAAVDWVALEVRCNRATNAQTMRRRLGVPYVESIDPGPGGAATCFRFRVQAPESWSEVVSTVAKIEGSIEHVQVVGVEVAVDAYPFGIANASEMREVAIYLRRGDCRPASENARFAGKKGTRGAVVAANTVTSLESGFREGRTLNVGDVSAPRSQRIYIKTTDCGGRPMDASKHRVRFENTLLAESFAEFGLPTDFNSWSGINFGSLGALFKFREMAEHGEETMRATMGRIPQIGQRQTRKRRGGGTRLYGRGTAASPLNEVIRGKLRDLSRRW